jgi:hypothetical protein
MPCKRPLDEHTLQEDPEEFLKSRSVAVQRECAVEQVPGQRWPIFDNAF